MKAVFLDIDNTLLSFDEYVKESMRTGFSAFGLPPYEDWMYDIFEEINNGFWRALERKEITFEELKRTRWDAVFQKLGMRADGIAFETYFRDRLCESAIPVEGAEKLLKALSGKVILCAASNGPEQQQIHRLEIAGMHRYFSHLFISEALGVSKPSPDFFHLAMEKLNEGREEKILPSEVLVVGDSLTSDVAGGKGYGMKTCLFSPKEQPIPEELTPDYLVTQLSDIPNCL